MRDGWKAKIGRPDKRRGAEGAEGRREIIFSLRNSAFSAVLSPNFVACCEDFRGARTALSAGCSRAGRDSRTRLSALLWLRRQPRYVSAFGFLMTVRRGGDGGEGGSAAPAERVGREAGRMVSQWTRDFMLAMDGAKRLECAGFSRAVVRAGDLEWRRIFVRAESGAEATAGRGKVQTLVPTPIVTDPPFPKSFREFCGHPRCAAARRCQRRG
jgi:hypothetical protein